MSVISFTNAQGEHSRTEMRRDYGVGTFLGNPYERELFHPVTTDWSYKSPTVHGDHDGPTNYTRKVMSIKIDRPYTWVDRYETSLGILRDIRNTEYISTKYPTAFMNPPEAFYGLLQNAYDRSITKALERLEKHKVEYGAAIAEAVQTGEMIAGNMKSVLYAYRAVRHGNFGLALKHLGISRNQVKSGQTFGNAWLQYIYGWLPLLSDIHDGADRLVNGYRDKGFIITSRCTSKAYYETGTRPDGQFDSDWVCDGSARVQIEARIKSRFLDNLAGSGVLNPLSVAWEVVPFSFVVDWFVPVGSVLESLTATAGLELAAGFTSVRYNAGFNSHAAHLGDGNELVDPGHMSLQQFSFERRVLAEFPMPRFYANNNPFKTPRILSAIALLRQMVGNSSRH